MDPRLVDDLEVRPSLPPANLPGGSDDFDWFTLRCACGGVAFRLLGWPRITTGRGGLFWRSLARVFREARQPMEAGELLESPFWLPMRARCEDCERSALVLDHERVSQRLATDSRAEPVESHRCRVCRRGKMALVLGHASDPSLPERADFVLVARCLACLRESRVAWSRGRPSEQEVALDLLYGRR